MKKFMVFFLALSALLVQPAFAEVRTTKNTEGFTDYVYVAGEADNYPVEYYDELARCYAGIIPDLLREISERTGINFVYINGDKSDREGLGANLQVDIVSSAEGRGNYGRDYLELVAFRQNGRRISAGLAFTALAGEDTVSAIKDAAAGISASVRNGIYLSYASRDPSANITLLVTALILALFLTGLVAALILRIRRIKKINVSERITDSETGMGNLHYFKYHFTNTIDDISRNLYHLAYIVLDSSYLRSYHGDSSFEEILGYTASVLAEHTGDREISARIAENGFAYAYQSTNEEDAKLRLEELMNKLNSFENMKGKSSKLVFHAATYQLLSTDRNCEILLFNLRKNCNNIFGSDRQIIYCDTRSMNTVQEEKKITESILKGFENDEFKMYLQFIVDNKTRRIVSAEALSRWDSMEKGLLSPGRYIENMEMSGLISRHDFHMFELACRQLEKWSSTKYRDITISCNFTRITLSEESFIDRLTMISDAYDFDRAKLSIEITEDAIEKDRDTARSNVTKCKELGFRVYLDDLGSGYTSLANLCDYPIDVVKIDRDILLKTDSQKGRDLFTGIVALAHSLNIKVICEGVETPEQNTLVTRSKCDYIQGWYYAKALPLEECEAFIEKHSARYSAVRA